MKFIILFEDSPSADPGIRAAHMPAHLSFLQSHADEIIAAGPLTDAEGRAKGGLWLLDAADEQAVERLIHDDAFWPTGLRKSYEIVRWRQFFANGKSLLPLS